MANTLEQVAEIVAKALLPLAEVLDASDDDIKGFVEQLGWMLPTVPPVFSNLQAASTRVVDALRNLESQRLELEEGAGSESNVLTALAQVLLTVSDLANEIHRLPDGLRSQLPTDFLSNTRIADAIEKRLFDFCVSTIIEENFSIVYRSLQLLGILEERLEAEDLTINQPEFFYRRVWWERIPQFLQNPQGVFQEIYGWGTPTLESEKLFETVYQLSEGLLVPAEIDYPSNALIQAVAPGVTIPTDDGPEPQLIIPLISSDVVTFSLAMYPIPKAIPAELQGLAITLIASGDISVEIPLSPNLKFTIESGIDLSPGVALMLRPDQPPTVKSNVLVAGGGAALQGRAAVRLTYASVEQQPVTVFEATGGSRLEFQRIYIGGGVQGDSSGQFDALIEVGLMGGNLLISLSGSDGFLSSTLPSSGIQATFDLGILWTKNQGISFQGSAALELLLPVHIDIGPVQLQNVYLILGLTANADLRLEASTALALRLGPLAASVERIGVQANLAFASGGNLGSVNLDFAFKPPNGVGLAVDAGVVKGGGYLYFDFEKEEYGGALELVFSGFLTLKAIGLITTKMPDGSKGFSLLVIIAAEFGTGLQLGFGFTLLGVGGLLGLNRTMKLQPLVDGVRTGAINNILFPRDVIANAPRIISDLRTIFPPEEGKFLIGPMAKLGWGTPTLVSLSLGIIIEIPGNIAILGVLRVALPTDDAALLVLQVSFIGAIEFDKKRIYFFASLFESRILFMTIEGEMGLLVAFGEDANFVVSVGGFHPRFNPPPLPFPNPVRIAINILNESNARIRVMGYFAVTSNTAQFGARAELFFGFDAFRVEGFIGFDALFQFSPFYFIIEVSAAVSLKAFGVGLFSIRLRFSLEGPTPWRARGTGSISFFFFEISADFDITWGESRDTTLPPIAVMPILKAEFEKLENWRALLPAANNLLVSLRQLDPVADLVLHPVGSLRITQKAIPLNISIDKVGSQKPSDAKRLSITVSTAGLGKKADATELFAIAQFQNLDDAKKLSAPGYEPEPAGLELSVVGSQFNSSKMVKRIVRYEEIIIDSNYKRFVRPFFLFVGMLFSHFLRGNSISKSVLSQAYQTQLQPFAEKIVVRPDIYAVAFQATNQVFTTETSFVSEAMARDFVQQQVAQNPDLHDTLHVIPQHEVAV